MEEVTARARRVVMDEWPDEELEQLEVVVRAPVARVRVCERVPTGDREPRELLLVDGPVEVADVAQRAAPSATKEGTYRDPVSPWTGVPKGLAIRASATIQEWQAASASGTTVEFDVFRDAWDVVELKVRGTRRRYFVELESRRVLSRLDPSVGLGKTIAKLCVVLVLLSSPLWLGAWGWLVVLLTLLWGVVYMGGKSSSMIGVGK